MSYRNRLLLKKALLVLGIIIVVIFLLLLIGYSYLGRYVVYTEDGAYFSFHSQSASSSRETTAAWSGMVDVISGEPISAATVSIGNSSIADTEVQGVLVDYITLKNGSTLNQIELGAESNNTLILELRSADQELLSSDAIDSLLARAKTQEVYLVAMISCLSDSDYALANPSLSIQISGGALWISSVGSYWLDPGQDAVITYLTELIQTVADMGFDEVLLTDFYLPTSSTVVYDYNGDSSETIMTRAFNYLVNATIDICQLSLLIDDPDAGHQAMAAAERIYVYYSDGSSVKDYAEEHSDQYLVFVTSSHDTRFNNYGKVEIGGEFTVDSVETVDETDDTTDSSEDLSSDEEDQSDSE